MLSLALLLAVQGVSEPAQPSFTPPPLAAVDQGPIEQVELGPIFSKPFLCYEHAEGELEFAGDALGSDCLIYGGDRKPEIMRLYRTDGATNEDWYGWGQDVLAPIEGLVRVVLINPVVNPPGTEGKPPASLIQIERPDGLNVTIAHVADVRVKEGDRVEAGQLIATVGNNGFSRKPHIHVGAFRENKPFQLRWDLRAIAKTRMSRSQ